MSNDTDSWEWKYDDEGNVIKTKVKHSDDDIEWLDEQTKELKTEIPDSPFDGGKEWETTIDTDRGFDDEDEELTDKEINDLINYQFESLEWKKDRKFSDLMKEGNPHIQRGFYCYVISQMSDESLEPYIRNYVDWLERMNYNNEIRKLPDESKNDEVVMDLKRRQIKDEGETLGNQVVEDMMGFLTNRGIFINDDEN